MESSLHRELKERYAVRPDRTEMVVDGYRIDAVVRRRLIEIQHSSLAGIRDKVRALLDRHQVTVVKPIVRRKHLVRLDAQGSVVGLRWSPKCGTLLDAFHELVYFTKVFPHRRLRLELPWVDIEEWRGPPAATRRRRWFKNYHLEDQRLGEVITTVVLRRAGDLWKLLETHLQMADPSAAGLQLPDPFHSGDLARALQIDRWVATRVAYCLRECGAVRARGKQRNAWLYHRRPSGVSSAGGPERRCAG